MIRVDMNKAREEHKGRIRELRKNKFTELDIQYQRALESSEDTTEIVAKKQALRDLPAAAGIATATTPEELKAQWDENLLGPSGYTELGWLPDL